MVRYSFYEIIYFLFSYSFLGWTVEVIFYSIRDRRFVNRGLVRLPFHLPCGISFAILIQVLPTLGRHFFLQYIAVCAVMIVVRSLTTVFCRQVSRMSQWEEYEKKEAPGQQGIKLILSAGGVLLVYHLVHPIFLTISIALPEIFLKIMAWFCGVLLLADFSFLLFAVRRSGRMNAAVEGIIASEAWTQRLADRITINVLNRLEKDYPELRPNISVRHSPVFAKGLCSDKLVWVFLISAFLGDIFEILYCGFVDGRWMNRSSVLYGPFSFVWGMGAVLLTITLHHLTDHSDRYVFWGGFLLGGTYEYICSVFTELVFGTVFWDYSKLPLNVNGRTNVLFCFFWGILAVAWVKVLYPYMERGIEKIPVLPGKIVTWIAIILMVCNGLLTMGVLVRYHVRASDDAPAGIVEEFLDTMYDDKYVEKRWPNMIIK